VPASWLRSQLPKWEKFYGHLRTTPVKDAGRSARALETQVGSARYVTDLGQSGMEKDAQGESITAGQG